MSKFWKKIFKEREINGFSICLHCFFQILCGSQKLYSFNNACFLPLDSKLCRSSELISTSKSLTVTTSGQNEELSPKIKIAWSPMFPQSSDTLNEVARKEVDEALTHAEVNRFKNFKILENSDKGKNCKN